MRFMFFAAAAMLAAAPANAEIFKDWTPSKEVWNVSYVHVKPAKLDDYLKGLKQTWVGACEEGKKTGDVLDCFIYVSDTMNNRDFNVMLVQKLPSAAVHDPDQARYERVTAALRAKLAQDKRDALVSNYTDWRTIFGEQDFRRVDLK